LEALGELPGVGSATLEQLKKALDFGEPGGNGGDRGQAGERGGGGHPGRAPAEAAETGIGGLRVVQQVTGAVAEVEREVMHRSAEATAELGRALMELMGEQTRQNLETLKALSEAVDWGRAAQAVDWDRVLQLQSEFWRVSLERSTLLTRRYLEVSQAVLNAATDTARGQAKKAA
jgi:hypothetical protein